MMRFFAMQGRLQTHEQARNAGRVAMMRAVHGMCLALSVIASSVHGQTPSLPSSSAWVANEKDDTLSRLDGKATHVIASIQTCKRPRHVAPRGGTLLVACSGSDAIDVIDPSTGLSLRRLPASDDPETFALSPDGRLLFAASEDKGDLVIVDIDAGKILARVPVGAEPEGVAVTPDGQRVFVTSEADNHVAVVDVAQARLIRKIPVGKRPRRLAWAAGGRELWVSLERDGALGVIDPVDMKLLSTIEIDSHGLPSPPLPAGMCVSADGQTLYAGLGRANHVAVIEVASRRVKAMVPAGSRVWGVALSPDETMLLAAGSLSNDVTVIDTKALRPLRTLAVGQAPQSIAFTSP